MLRFLAVMVALAPVSVAVAQASQAGQAKRPFVFEDFLKMESIGNVTFSPDGEALAFVRMRPRTDTRQDYAVPFSNGGDVWVQLTRNVQPRNLTNGTRDGTSWWDARWSPDGKWISMRSSRGGKVGVWVWERATGKLASLGVEPYIGRDSEDWTHDSRLLVHVRHPGDTLRGTKPVLPKGDALLKDERFGGAGTSLDGERWMQGPLVAIDPRNGSRRTVARRVGETRGPSADAFGLRVSPGRDMVASSYIERVVSLNADMKAFEYTLGFYQLDVALQVHDLRTNRTLSFSRALPGRIYPRTVEWSRDGTELAYLARAASEGGYPQLVRVRPATGDVNVRSMDILAREPLRVQSLQLDWANSGDVLVRYACESGEVLGKPVCEKSTWYAVPASGTARAIDTATKTLAVDDPDAKARKRADSVTAKPHPNANVVAATKGATELAFVKNDTTGLSLWRVRAGGSAGAPVVTANAHLAEAEYARKETIEYQGPGGKKLRARVYRPARARPGDKLPAIVYHYPLRNVPARIFPSIARSLADFEAWAAKGYTIVWASADRDLNGEMMPHLMDGITPILDTLIKRGLVDSTRMFLTGASCGGFSTVGILTQTQRFRAGAALAGVYNLPSMYLSTGGTSRTQQLHNALPSWAPYYEAAATCGDMKGEKPWTSPGMYTRNSPVFLADKVNTPVLLLHGDDDGVVVEQSEAMFAALSRLGKHAKLVRYWGEDHGMGVRPSSQRDVHQQIISWFDEHGDIARDAAGNMIMEGGRAKSRNAAPVLIPE